MIDSIERHWLAFVAMVLGWLRNRRHVLGRANGVLPILASISDLLRQDPGAARTIDRICRIASELPGILSATACIIDSDSGDLRVESAHPASSSPHQSPQRIGTPVCTADSALHRCLASSTPTVCDRQAIENVIMPLDDDARRFLVVPLVRCGMSYGALIVGARGKRPLQKNKSVLEALAGLATMTISQEASSQSLDSRLEKIRSISAILSSVSPHAGVPTIRNVIVEAARRALGTELFALFTIDSYTGTIECQSTEGVGEVLRNAFVDLYGNDITDREKRDPWVVADLANADASDQQAWHVLCDCGVRGLVACPIRSEASASGAIVAFYPTKVWRPREKLAIAEAIAAQAATALSYALAIEQSSYLLDDLAGANQELSQQATVDGLTALANHRLFQQTLSELCKRAAGSRRRTFSLIMADVDHFKIYNDMYGHQQGDEILRQVARTMSGALRQGDLAARYGGEEFAIILQNTSKEGAYKAADRVRRAIAERSYEKGSVTVSMGVAEFPADGKSPRDLIENADKALYQAKITGRNRVFAWGLAGSLSPERPAAIDAEVGRRSALVVENPEEDQAGMIGDTLLSQSYSVQITGSMSEATDFLRTRAFDIAMISVEALPDRDVGAIGAIAAIHPNMPIVLLAPGLAMRESREALRRGASDILLKPYSPADLPVVIERNLERKKLGLEKVAQKGTSVVLQATEAMVAAVEARDPDTARHSRRLASMCLAIADDLNLCGEERHALELAARLHDIGKLALPDSALSKQLPLTEEEWAVMRQHPALGSKIVGAIDELAYVGTIIRHHHERLDGTGYPDGLRGPAIPYLSRLIAVVDAYDAMASEQAHRGRLTTGEALEELSRRAGTYYSDEVVDALRRQLIASGEMIEKDAAA